MTSNRHKLFVYSHIKEKHSGYSNKSDEKQKSCVCVKMPQRYLSASTLKRDGTRRFFQRLKQPSLCSFPLNDAHKFCNKFSSARTSCHFFNNLFLPTATKRRSVSILLHIIILVCLFSDKPVWSRIEKVNYRQKEKQILDNILGKGIDGKGYDKRIRPSGNNDTDGPATINVNIYLRTISRIDDVKMEYSVQVTFREQWNDERLRYYDDTQGRLKYLTLTDPTKVWMPDTFFRNEKEARKHEIIVPNVYVRIFPNGEILYSIRISLTLACPMDLRLYPLDKQVCVLQIASYGWAKDDLIYKWKEKDPVQVVPGLHLPRFTLEQYKSAYCDVITNTGEYSCLKVELIFKREFSYYLITIYVPCCMLVIVSWVSFWLDQNAIPARVSLGVTTLLTMSTQTSGINAQLPPVSYTKAIDVWTGVCQCFVFCALLEFALVNYASRSDMQRDRARERMERAKRQWELEHASDTCIDGLGNNSQEDKSAGDNNGTGSACNTLSSNKGTNNSGSGAVVTMNHINATASGSNAPGITTSSDTFNLKKRTNSTMQDSAFRNFSGLDPSFSQTHITTTQYPHQHPSSPDAFADQFNASQINPYLLSTRLSSNQLANIDPATGALHLATQIPRQCEVHMNSYQQVFGMTPSGALEEANGANGSSNQNLKFRSSSHQLFQQAKVTIPQAILQVLFYCCRANGLLAKFPSRAKRIDVLSRFIFPLIFAIFNLAYWLYYLLAKNNFSGSKLA